MTELKLRLETENGYLEYKECSGFTFEKERYTPYTYFSGVFYGKCIPEKIKAVMFYLNGNLVHYGIADSIVSERKNGISLIKVRSFGFTMLLGQNQSEPGILSDATLGAIIDRNIDIYTVGYQENTEMVNYVYINPNASVWEAICVYTMKAYHTYPFIGKNNVVRCTRSGNTSFTYSGSIITEAVSGMKLTNLISHGYTNNLAGEWVYTKQNDFAISKHITKQKYYNLEKDFVYNLNDQLRYKLNYADRSRLFSYFTYLGYKGEDLLDTATIDTEGLSIRMAEIDRVKVSGSSKGVSTSVYFYWDSYCNTDDE